MTALVFIGTVYKSLTFLLHGRIADENSPHIGAGLRDHQHPDHGDGIGPKNNGNVETEAQHDGQPHPAESRAVSATSA